MKNIIIGVLVLLLVAAGVFIYMQGSSVEVTVDQREEEADVMEDEMPIPVEPDGGIGDGALPLPEEVIGTSASGNEITAFRYGEGNTELLFVGGIHGGYSWNTALVSYELMDFFESNPEVIPENVTVTVIPVVNPDGLSTVVGSTGRFARSDAPTSESERIPGRFNANNVDLNRNFDCGWRPEGTWRNTTVDAGSEPFSEPEAAAIRDYVRENVPDAVVAFYSAAGGVFASSCNGDVLSETRAITNVYANASGYPAFEEFDFYEITGDMVNWLAKNNIPAISVLLTTHTDTELSKNLRGIEALLDFYSN